MAGMLNKQARLVRLYIRCKYRLLPSFLTLKASEYRQGLSMSEIYAVPDVSVTVLLAEDSDAIRSAIKRILKDQPGIALVGEAVNFSQTLQMCADLQPKVVLLDLHMPGEEDFSPDFIKSKLLVCAKHLLAISIWNDEQAKTLAASYGAANLLDKVSLGSQLVPTILRLV